MMTDGGHGLVVRVTSGPSMGAMMAIRAPLVIGREGEFAVADPTVSRRHIVLEPSGASVVVRDAGSSNGYSINGVPGSDGNVVGPGDEIIIGRTALQVLRLTRHHEGPAGPYLLIDERAGRIRAFPLGEATTIGRDPDADLTIEHPAVSRHHLTVRVSPAGATAEDHSSNGTSVSGEPIRGEVNLVDGDVITLGSAPVSLTLNLGSGGGSPVTMSLLAEGAPMAEITTIDAAPTATVADVTLALAANLGRAERAGLLYRMNDGVLLHPDDAWRSTGPTHGDVLVLGVGDASEIAPARGRYWPRAKPTPLNQLPRTVLPPPKSTITPPRTPETLAWKGRGVMWQIIGGMGIVAMGIVMALVRPEFAIFGLMAGLIGLLAIAASIFGEQSRRRYRVREFGELLRSMDARLSNIASEQIAQHRRVSPTTADIDDWLQCSSHRFWERRPQDSDVLRLRLGIGQRPLALEVDDNQRGVVGNAAEIIDRHRFTGPVPVLGPGPQTGSYGIVGDRLTTIGMVRRLLIEAAVLHPPHQLDIWVLAVDDQWQWTRWLPQTGDTGRRVSSGSGEATQLVDELLEELARTSSTSSDQPDHFHLVVVPSAWDRGAFQSVVDRLLHRGLAIIVSDDQRSLPNGLASLVDVRADGTATLTGSYEDAPSGPFVVDTLTSDEAERLALRLAHLAAGSGSSSSEGITELLGLGPVGSIDVAASWATPRREPLTVAIGADHSGEPVTVGFRRDGPHGMIAGTTGSGKSELLQTLLGALAMTHRPDQLALFLIDYKGGATFAPLAALPHVVGMVTDLENDSSLATRAFTALDAEIMRRKRTLDDAGVPNIIEYERLNDPSLPLVPNLLVVIDEFALMVKSQPQLKERLDTVATQGRSLGVHMLLATQSPTGVITHAVRTNTNLWISLRVVTDSESLELLGARDAARLPDGSPGRGLIRLGAGDNLRGFQAARIARSVNDDNETVRITRKGDHPSLSASSGRTELDVAVERIVDAWQATGLAVPVALWLPPLPTELPAELLAETTVSTDRLVGVVGLADHPEEQRQDPYIVDLSTTGHLVVAGVLGSGKTTALLQLATSLAENHPPDELHLYAIDAGAGSLSPLAELPHAAGVVGSHDAERLTRLLDRLDRIVDERRDALAAAGAGDFLRWRASGGNEPWIVLLIDDLPAFRESAENIEMGRLVNRFVSLLQNGPSVGVHLVLSINQQIDLRMREASLVPERIMLRLTDPADYAMVEVRIRPGEVPPFPPGRGIVAGPTWIQIAETSPVRLAQVAIRWNGNGGPRPIERLPKEISRASIPPSDAPLLLGVGGLESDAVGIDLDRGAPVLLIAGPIQSGRSTSLLTALEGILEHEPHRRVTVVALRPGPLRDLASTHPDVAVVTSGSDLKSALDAVLETDVPGVVILDDAEGLAGLPGVSERLELLVRGASERDTRVLVGARVSDLASIFEPWARFIVSLRRAVLIHPTQDDAFAFGVRLPTVPPPAVPGRGVLIDGANVSVVQLATP